VLDLLELPGNYKLIYVDPPWHYYGNTDKDQAAGKHYNTMTFEELVALPVPKIIAKTAVMFMWTTGPKLAEAILLMQAWGFHYRCVGYVWIKTSKDGDVIEGQGVRPSFVKQMDEFVIVGSTEPRGRTLPIFTESQAQNIFASRGEHSEKPDEARWRLEELFGPIPRLEMFARCRCPGWDAWGFEADGPMPEYLAESPRLRAKLHRKQELASQKALTELIWDLPQE
jgi:N6-adenosine-specific RNA methylase IME4